MNAEANKTNGQENPPKAGSEPKTTSDTSLPGAQQLNNPIARKLNKILESRVENDKVCAKFNQI